jgi:hypothetical protein
VIVIDPKEFPSIEEMPVYWWFAQINRGTMGAARALNKAESALPRRPAGANPRRKDGRKDRSVSLLDLNDSELDQLLGPKDSAGEHEAIS